MTCRGKNCMPLFFFLQRATKHEGSRILGLLQGLPFKCKSRNDWNHTDMAELVLQRIFRDGRKMPAHDYLALAKNVKYRYDARVLEERGLLLYNGIGQVWFEGGVIQFVGKNAGPEEMVMIREVHYAVAQEMAKPKYKKLSKQEYDLIKFIIELKGYLNGKARIFRQKSDRSTRKRARAYAPSIADYGRVDQQRN